MRSVGVWGVMVWGDGQITKTPTGYLTDKKVISVLTLHYYTREQAYY